MFGASQEYEASMTEDTYEDSDEDEGGYLDSLANYFDEKEAERGPVQQKCCGKCCRYTVFGILFFFFVWNGVKLPCYYEVQPMTSANYNETKCEVGFVPDPELDGDFDPEDCFGMPTQVNLWVMSGFKFKPYYKLMSQQFLFLAPHTAMGCVLEMLLLLGLWQGRKMLIYHSPYFLVITIIFAIHILPVAKGIPDSLSGAPVNETLCAMLIIAALFGIGGLLVEYKRKHVAEKNDANALLFYSWIAIGIMINLAPLGEWGLILSTVGEEPETMVPHPLSGRGFYAQMEDKQGAKWIGIVISAGIALGAILYLPGAFYPQWYHDKMGDDAGPPGPAMYQLLVEPAHTVGYTINTRPLKFLQATGESFILMLIITHCITIIANPSVYETNILKAVVGYNNLCVGFDTQPARTIAMPLQVLSAYYAFRFVSVDTIRLYAQKEELTGFQFWFERIANTAFLTIMICFPLLLIITPTWENWPQTRAHFFIFVGALFSMWLRMTASRVTNYKDWTVPTHCWWGMFTFHTFGLAVVGGLDCMFFANDLEEGVAISTLELAHPDPYCPWQLCCYFDFGWFMLLGMAVVYLPHEVPLKITFEYDEKEDSPPQPANSYVTIGRAAPVNMVPVYQ